ncbi:MAG: NDP-sugar synthase [Nannocystaceae bacterium]
MPIEFGHKTWNERWAAQLPPHQSLRGSILAAGLGRRLEPLTKHHLPKPLFPIGGRVPIAELWVRKMIEAGISDVSMNVCVLADSIRRHFDNGAAFGINIGFVHEDVPTGTLGGVCKQALGPHAKTVVAGEPRPDVANFEGSTLLVPSGDIVTSFDATLIQEMYDLHRRRGAALTMVVNPIPAARRKDFGTVILDATEDHRGGLRQSGRIVGFAEKDPNSPSNLNNASIYLIETELLRTLDALRTEAAVGVDAPFYDFGKHVFPALLGQLPQARIGTDYPMLAVRYDGEWFDVGTKRDYLRVNEHYLAGKIAGPTSYSPTAWGQCGDGVEMDLRHVRIVPPVVIGSRCTIESGAQLGPHAVIGDGWTVGANAVIQHSVLWGAETHHARPLPMEVAPGVRISRCIVAGGRVDRDVEDATVRPADDNDGPGLAVLSIDSVPQGPRA